MSGGGGPRDKQKKETMGGKKQKKNIKMPCLITPPPTLSFLGMLISGKDVVIGLDSDLKNEGLNGD